jgi:hypothetical protein
MCSHTFRGYQEFLRRPDIDKVLRKLGKVLDLATVTEKFKLFDDYLSQGTECPEVEIPDSAASSMVRGTPWLQCLRVVLMTQFHVSSEDVWDYPYRQAVWDSCSFREGEGRLQIIGEDNSAERQDRVDMLLAANEEIRKAMGFAPEAQNGS